MSVETTKELQEQVQLVDDLQTLQIQLLILMLIDDVDLDTKQVDRPSRELHSHLVSFQILDKVMNLPDSSYQPTNEH